MNKIFSSRQNLKSQGIPQGLIEQSRENAKCDSGLHRAVVIRPGLYWLSPRKREYSR